MEIGSAALNILVECWDGHLTPPEVASLADRASRARDPNMVRAAAELALSCLPHAHALNPNEIQRALVQCKEQVLSLDPHLFIIFILYSSNKGPFHNCLNIICVPLGQCDAGEGVHGCRGGGQGWRSVS